MKGFKEFLDLLKILAITGLLAVVIVAVFLLLGWEDGARKLAIQVGSTLGVNLAMYGGAILLFMLVAARARRRAAVEMDEFPHLMVPCIGAFILPSMCLVFFLAIWGVMIASGAGEEFLDGMRSGDLDKYIVFFTLSALAGPVGAIGLLYLSFTRVAWSDRAVRVSRFLRPTHTIQWREIERMVFKRSKKSPITGVTLYTAQGKIKIPYMLYDYEREWLPFGIAAAQIAQSLHIPVLREGPEYQRKGPERPEWQEKRR